VFVSGYTDTGPGYEDFATIAYDAATGDQLWIERYNGAAGGLDEAFFIGVSPDGRRVFVSGLSEGLSTGIDYATVAYDAGTGTQLWVARYDGPGHDSDDVDALAVSPDGAEVFVTGQSTGAAGDFDYATTALDAVSGSELWVRRFDGSAHVSDSAYGLAVSPDARAVFVTGNAVMGDSGECVTLAYDAGSGVPLWRNINRGQGASGGAGYAAAVSPDGSTLFVTGETGGVSSYADYLTLSIGAVSGRTNWARYYNGPGNDFDKSYYLALSPDGSRLYVTGFSEGALTNSDYFTIAYAASSGLPVWARRFTGAGAHVDNPSGIALSEDGRYVYVTGVSGRGYLATDYATVAYVASTGAALGVRRFPGIGKVADLAEGIAVNATTVFVTGRTASSSYDMTTLAYRI